MRPMPATCSIWRTVKPRKRLATPLRLRVTSRFHLGHLALVQQAFADAEVHLYHDAFLFPTLDAALRYYLSGIVDLIEDAPPDGHHVQQLLPAMRERLQRKLDSAGRLRVPKDAGCFVAKKR
jgi:hypothetical protein